MTKHQYKPGDSVRRPTHHHHTAFLIRLDTDNGRFSDRWLVMDESDNTLDHWTEPHFEPLTPSEPELKEGDRVKHETLGEGVIPKRRMATVKIGGVEYGKIVDPVRGVATVKFDSGWSQPIALSLLTKIEPEEEDEESLNAAFVASIGQLKLQTPPCCGCLKDLNYGASYLSATCICGRYKKMLSGNIFHCAFPEPPTVVQNNGSEPLKEQEAEAPIVITRSDMGLCEYCNYPQQMCEPLWNEQRKCCPDCTHTPSVKPQQEKSLRERLDECLPIAYEYQVDDVERVFHEHFDSNGGAIQKLFIDVAHEREGTIDAQVKLTELLFGDNQ
jgi:hypothetical protein